MNWSSLGLGVVLTKKDDYDWEYVVAMRSNNITEANYSSYKGKSLAAVWVIAHF